MKKILVLFMLIMLFGCGSSSEVVSITNSYQNATEEGRKPDVGSIIEEALNDFEWSDNLNEDLFEVKQIVSEKLDDRDFKESNQSLEKILEDYLNKHFDMEIEPIETPWGGLGS